MGKLGQLLVARGWITVQQLTRALKNQNVVGGRLGTCLLEMDVLGEELLARALSEQLGVPAGEIEDLRAIPDEVLSLIPEKLARRCRAIPFRVAGGRLDVMMQDPRNLVCQDEIAFACGRRVKVHVLHELRIQEALQRYYREEMPSRLVLLLDRLNRARYLWSEDRKRSGVPAGGEPGERTEILSRLPADDLLGGPPRKMVPPPLPEPSLPARARRGRTRSNTVAAAADPAETPASPAASSRLEATPRPASGFTAGNAEATALTAAARTGAFEVQDLQGLHGFAEPQRAGRFGDPPSLPPLPPLAELDLRAAPRRPRPADSADSADDAESRPATPQPPTTPMMTAAAPPGARDAASSSATDLETTLVLTPPSLRPPTAPQRIVTPPPAAPARPDRTSVEVRTLSLPVHQIVTLTAEERADLAAAAGQAGAANPTVPSTPTDPTDPADLDVALAPPEREAAAAATPLAAVAAVPAAGAAAAAAAATAGGMAPPPQPPQVLPRAAPTDLAEVEAAFAATTDSEEVGRILLGYLARSFRRVALFQVGKDRLTSWMAHGDDIDQAAFARYAVSFQQPSVFLNLRQGSGIHIGPLAPMESHRELALCWGGGLPRDCLALPVRLRDRLVLVLYADGGNRGLGGVDLEQMHRLTALTSAAFERCILHKKRGYAQS